MAKEDYYELLGVAKTATAEEMSGQAEQLQQLMSFFKLGGDAAHAIGLAAKPKALSQHRTVSRRMASNLAPDLEETLDESEFAKF